MTKVTKEVMFECAHMLSNYDGQCRNLHGHSYKLQVAVEGVTIDNPEDPKHCMLLDFSDLKEGIKEIIDPMDHAILFSTPALQDEAEKHLYQWATTYGMKYKVFPERTTCECMVHVLRIEVERFLMAHGIAFKQVNVRLWETATSFAEV